MKIALYSRDGRAMSDGRLSRMFGKLEKESFDFYEISGEKTFFRRLTLS